jgi:hypothetical protein
MLPLALIPLLMSMGVLGGTTVAPYVADKARGKIAGAVDDLRPNFTPRPENIQMPQTQPQYTPNTQSFEDIMRKFVQDQNQNSNNTGGGQRQQSSLPQGFDPESMINSQREAARAAYEEGLTRARSGFDRARGLYDEGMGLLDTRRNQFKELYDEGQGNILNRFQEEAGNLQRSAQGEQTRNANALRAMGLGGSAMVRSQGRQTQDNMRALGNLQTQRSQNETGLRRENEERDLWARTQESALNRQLSDAGEARRQAESQLDLVNMGNENQIRQNAMSFLDNIASRQSALAAANQGIQGFEANPYSINIDSFANSLNNQIQGSGPQAQGDGASNLAENPRILEMMAMGGGYTDPRQRQGLMGGGLYQGLNA